MPVPIWNCDPLSQPEAQFRLKIRLSIRLEIWWVIALTDHLVGFTKLVKMLFEQYAASRCALRNEKKRVV